MDEAQKRYSMPRSVQQLEDARGLFKQLLHRAVQVCSQAISYKRCGLQV
jgi:hypothetical protein